MADLPHHDNSPPRRVALLPRSSYDDERHESKRESVDSRNGESTAACPLSESHRRRPAADVAALLKRIRAHPEAERILGNSLIPVVGLERLSFQSLMRVQPVVSPVHQHLPELHHISSHQPLQTELYQPEVDVLDFVEESPESEPAMTSDLSHSGTTSIIYSGPDDFPYQESYPDQSGYILFDSGSHEWYLDGDPDSETFYLDPDSEQTVVINVDPDQHRSLQLEDEENDTKFEVNVADLGEGEKQDGCLEEDVVEEEKECEPSIIHQPGPGDGAEEVESEDFCAVCLNGGDLLCCDSCPKVYHLACHMPTLTSFPLGDWVCTLCRSDQEPEETYDCESIHRCGGGGAPYSLSHQEQRRCEKLTLLLLCHLLSAPFHEPVSRLARNYYQIIKRPVDLSLIRRKLEETGTLRYFSAQHFVDDVLLMFRNCATFNYPDSDVAQAGRNLQQFFFTKLKEIFPERTFPSAAEHREDAARLHWLNRKRTENYRKGRRHVFHGKNPFIC